MVTVVATMVGYSVSQFGLGFGFSLEDTKVEQLCSMVLVCEDVLEVTMLHRLHVLQVHLAPTTKALQ